MHDIIPLAWPLLACALHRTWFASNLPCHVFHALRVLGLGRNKEGFWSVSGDELHYYDDWFVWFNTNLYLPGWLRELLTCPRCLAWHIPFWFTVLGAALGTVQDPAHFIFWYAAGVYLCQTQGSK